MAIVGGAHEQQNHQRQLVQHKAKILSPNGSEINTLLTSSHSHQSISRKLLRGKSTSASKWLESSLHSRDINKHHHDKYDDNNNDNDNYCNNLILSPSNIETSSIIENSDTEDKQQIDGKPKIPNANGDNSKEFYPPNLGQIISEQQHDPRQLPYFSYQGRARQVKLISANDRKSEWTRASSELSDISHCNSISSCQQQSNITNNRPSNNSRKELLKARGYRNISNLFPNEPMSDSFRPQNFNRRTHDQKLDFKSNSKPQGVNLSDDIEKDKQQRQHQHQHQHHHQINKRTLSKSLVNLDQRSFINHNKNDKSSQNKKSTTMRRHNSLLGANAGAGPISQSGQNDRIGAIGKVGIQSSNLGARPASVSGNYGRDLAQGQTLSASVPGATSRSHHHRRSPSASSLHYASNAAATAAAAMQSEANLYLPYQDHRRNAYDQDPDCPVHGMSAYELDKIPIDSTMASPSDESPYGYPLYNSRRRGPGFYETRAPDDHRRKQAYASAYSLYSPTSPIERGQLGPSAAYYDQPSRFSVYHTSRDPADLAYTKAGITRSSLAPPKEQLRRVLGYPTDMRPLKPVHLHPQWAYSRPFHHLLPSGAEWTAPSPVVEGEHLIDYDDQVNQVNSSLLRFSPFNRLEDTQAIRAVDFHPSGQVYAIGSNSRALRICAYPAPSELNQFGASLIDSPIGSSAANQVQSPRVLFKFLQVHRGSIYCVRFNRTGQLLATGSNDQTVHIVRYNSRTHSPEGDEYRLTMHDGTVRDLCFIDDSTSGNSLLLSAGGGDNKIYVTDCDTITPFQSFAGHTGMVMALHHLGGAQFVSGSQDRTIRFWDLRTRQCTSIVSAPPARIGSRWSGGPGAPVCAVQADHSGRLLVSGHTDSTCMLYDTRGAKIIQAFKPHEDEIRTVSFSPKSYYLLTGAYDGRIVLSDLQGDLNQSLPSVCVAESDDKIIQSRWHPTDFTFVTTSANKTATLWVPPSENR